MKYLLLLLFSLCVTATGKYNVLFIAIDDMRPELKYLGVEHAITPEMDKLSQVVKM